MVNALPYIGIRLLYKAIPGIGRNLIMDNWFSSVPLADNILKGHKFTIVGTTRKIKHEIATSFHFKNLSRRIFIG